MNEAVQETAHAFQLALFGGPEPVETPSRAIPADKERRLRMQLRRRLEDDETPQLSLEDQARVSAWGTYCVRPYGPDWDLTE